MKLKYLLPLLAVLPTPAFADDDAMMALAKKSNCMACHSVDKKLVGPAYKDVAKKYDGNAGAEANLVEKVKKGGKGVWGAIPMPPNATVKDADVQALVQWILSLK